MTLSWTHLWIRPKWCIENWSYFYKNDNFWTNEYKKLSIVSCYSILFWLIFCLRFCRAIMECLEKLNGHFLRPQRAKKCDSDNHVELIITKQIVTSRKIHFQRDWEWRGRPWTTLHSGQKFKRLRTTLLTNSRLLSDCRIQGAPKVPKISFKCATTSKELFLCSARNSTNFVRWSYNYYG